MASGEFAVKGLRELGETLKELPDRVAKKVLRNALKKAAIPIRNEAQRRVLRAAGGPTYPVQKPGSRKGGPKGPGHAADNIIAKVSLTKKRGAEAKVGPDAPHWYVAFQEFGTPQAPGDAPLSEALKSQGHRAVDIFAKELGTGIEKEATKLARGKGAV